MPNISPCKLILKVSLNLRAQIVTPQKTNTVLTFSPLIFTKYEPCLYILITQVATYASGFFFSFLFFCTEA